MIEIDGVDNVIRSIKGFDSKITRKAYESVKLATDVLERGVRHNISYDDHTQKDLDEMDHPYAKRHKSKSQVPHAPYWIVHNQTGRLSGSLYKKVEVQHGGGVLGGNIIVGSVGLDPEKCEYVNDIVFGNRTMISRSPLTETVRILKDDIEKIIKEQL